MAAWSTTAVSLTCTHTRRGRNGGKELLVDRWRAQPCVWVISCCYLSADWIVVLFWLFFLGLLPTARPPRRQHIMQHHWFTFCYIVVFLIVPRIINKLKHLDRALHKQERTHCIWIPLLAAWVLSLCFALGFFFIQRLVDDHKWMRNIIPTAITEIPTFRHTSFSVSYLTDKKREDLALYILRR